ncbi:MAG: hypothetical protein H6Q44_296 [Deltaproteobacteria bacterium]|nr:hypothetical protein [Deltaproteobacteria bacterium]
MPIPEHILPFEDDERADPPLGQVERRLGYILHHYPVQGLGSAQKESNGTHPVQDLADLRLKNHHNDDQDDRP